MNTFAIKRFINNPTDLLNLDVTEEELFEDENEQHDIDIEQLKYDTNPDSIDFADDVQLGVIFSRIAKTNKQQAEKNAEQIEEFRKEKEKKEIAKRKREIAKIRKANEQLRQQNERPKSAVETPKTTNEQLNKTEELFMPEEVIDPKIEPKMQYSKVEYTGNYKVDYENCLKLEVPKKKEDQTVLDYYLERLFYDNPKWTNVVMDTTVTKYSKDRPEKHMIVKRLEDLGSYKDIYEEQEYNLHLVLNSFIFRKDNFRKSKENVHFLNAFFVDIDYYNKDLTLDQTLEKLDQILEENNIPTPTFKVNSGGGLYIIWKITAKPNNRNSILYYYNQVQEYLNGLLESIGADKAAKDASRMLKVPTSINAKYEHLPAVELINIDYKPHSFEEFTTLLPKKEEKKSIKNAQTKEEYTKNQLKGLKSGKSRESLIEERINDFLTLDDMRKSEGYRNNMLFYSFAMLNKIGKYSKNEVEQKIKAMNEKLNNPLEDSEVEGILNRNVEGWKLTNSFLIKNLNIKRNEQEKLQVIIGAEEKQKRRVKQNKKYYDKKESTILKRTKKELQNETIKNMKEEGKSQKEVIEELENIGAPLSLSTLKRRWKSF